MRLIHVRGTGLAINAADALSLFPGCVNLEERIEAMKTLKQILFTLVVVAGLSLTASAQRGGGQQRPPKQPKEIPARPKDNPKPKEDKPKKPGMSYFVALPPETEYSE